MVQVLRCLGFRVPETRKDMRQRRQKVAEVSIQEAAPDFRSLGLFMGGPSGAFKRAHSGKGWLGNRGRNN